MPKGEVDYYRSEGIHPNNSVVDGRYQALQNWRTQNPPGGTTSGGRRGGGGYGGGMAATAGIDQGTYDYLLGLINKNRPKNFTMDPYVAPEFYDFDTSMYDQARTGLDEGIAADRQYGMGAFADARTELEQYQNPFDPDTVYTDPGISDAMRRMIEANDGLGMDEALRQDAIAGEADRAMENTLALLAGVDQQRQASNLRALAGDERGFNERLDAAARNLGLNIDLAQGRAKSAYDKDRFGYEAGNARQGYEDLLGINLMNYQTANDYNTQMLDPIMELVMLGMLNGKQTLKL